MKDKDADQLLGKLGQTQQGYLTISEFIHDVVGLPHDFFDMDLLKGNKAGGEEAEPVKMVTKELPPDTSIDKVSMPDCGPNTAPEVTPPYSCSRYLPTRW